MDPLTSPNGLMVPRVYVDNDHTPPAVMIGCACGWTRPFPDGVLAVRVTMASSRHMLEAHLGQTSLMASDAAESLLQVLDDQLRALDGR